MLMEMKCTLHLSTGLGRASIGAGLSLWPDASLALSYSVQIADQ